MAIKKNDPDFISIRPRPLGCEVTILTGKPFQLHPLLRLGKMGDHFVPPILEDSIGADPKKRCAYICDHELHSNRLQQLTDILGGQRAPPVPGAGSGFVKEFG